jgi:chromosome segregation ATPase
MSKLIKATAILATLVSVNAMSKVDCKPFKMESDLKTQIVTNFNDTILKLQTKANQMQIKFEDRMSMIAGVDAKINNIQMTLEQIKNDSQNIRISMRDIKSSLDSAIAQEQDLLNLIADLDNQIANAYPGSNNRRNAMREKKRTERKLISISDIVRDLQIQISPMQNQLAGLKAEKQNVISILETLNQEKFAIEDMRPTLNSLIRKKEMAQKDLVDADQNQELNIIQMDEANEKVLMCKTYNVKYPVSLSVSRELYTVGCENYVLKGYNGVNKIAAEQETINAVCE